MATKPALSEVEGPPGHKEKFSRCPVEVAHLVRQRRINHGCVECKSSLKTQLSDD